MASLHVGLTGSEDIVITTRAAINTSALTTTGRVTGRLIGGNLDTMAACVGWALPNLAGAVLLIEDIDKQPGHIDRQLTMLRKSGTFDGVAAFAVGDFPNCQWSGRATICDVLADHLTRFNVPVLGGLPLGHGEKPLTVPLGFPVTIDCAASTLAVDRSGTANVSD